MTDVSLFSDRLELAPAADSSDIESQLRQALEEAFKPALLLTQGKDGTYGTIDDAARRDTSSQVSDETVASSQDAENADLIAAGAQPTRVSGETSGE